LLITEGLNDESILNSLAPARNFDFTGAAADAAAAEIVLVDDDDDEDAEEDAAAAAGADTGADSEADEMDDAAVEEVEAALLDIAAADAGVVALALFAAVATIFAALSCASNEMSMTGDTDFAGAPAPTAAEPLTGEDEGDGEAAAEGAAGDAATAAAGATGLVDGDDLAADDAGVSGDLRGVVPVVASTVPADCLLLRAKSPGLYAFGFLLALLTGSRLTSENRSPSSALRSRPTRADPSTPSRSRRSCIEPAVFVRIERASASA
jgi:hypothetical protein